MKHVSINDISELSTNLLFCTEYLEHVAMGWSSFGLNMIVIFVVP